MTRAPAGPAFLNLLDPTFSLQSAESIAAREQHWYAETPLGYAVLRHRECNELLRDRRLRQQELDVLTMQGVTEGPLVTFWGKAMLGMNDEPHLRVRTLVQAAFTPRHVEALRPQVQAVINELVEDLRERDQVDFMAAFADRFPVQIIGAMLGVPPADAGRLARWTETLGLMFAIPVNPLSPPSTPR